MPSAVLSEAERKAKENTKGDANPDVQGYKARRYAVKFSPPCIFLEYEDTSKKRRVRAVRLEASNSWPFALPCILAGTNKIRPHNHAGEAQWGPGDRRPRQVNAEGVLLTARGRCLLSTCLNPQLAPRLATVLPSPQP